MGEWDWHDIVLTMRPPTLIPRPETEELVELILDWLRPLATVGTEACHFLDVGAGTGAIGLALLNRLSSAQCCACDVSADAVQLSLENAVKVCMQLHFYCCI
jgi:release factor glutamine methyltransferase